jgi:hypothetical protein
MGLVNGVKRIYDRYRIAIAFVQTGDLDNNELFIQVKFNRRFVSKFGFCPDDECYKNFRELLRPSLPPNSELLRMASEPEVHSRELLRGTDESQQT